MSMVRERGQLTLFNTEKVSETELVNGDGGGGALVVDRFASSVKMSTYLVAFVLCDYQRNTRRTNSSIEVGRRVELKQRLWYYH